MLHKRHISEINLSKTHANLISKWNWILLMKELYFIYLSVGLIGLYLVKKIYIRLKLSKAKHPSLRGHSKWSRRIAKHIKDFSYDTYHFYNSDGAPQHISKKRQEGLFTLEATIKALSPKSIAYQESLEKSISDIQFTSRYRIPFPYQDKLPKTLKMGTIVEESAGTKIKDLDGEWRYDLSGSYGVNVFGYDFYKKCLNSGYEHVKNLGPVLGGYHPLIAENVKLIKDASGLDEVSFHMSGTEAVMQAVRLARYHTGKTHLVRFCGAYHGWWDGVQPGIGNKRDVNDVYTLNDMSESALNVIKTRNDIACVLINPLQAFHPNTDSPSDTSLIASDRSTNFDKKAYSQWLQKLREVCTRCNIVLIFDEVFTGFRLSQKGAQGYFDVQADMVTYGKTLGGGLPVGVVAGRHYLMKRYKSKTPINVSFARGTFNSHPYVIGAMNEFLIQIQSPEIQHIYKTAEHTWNQRVASFNQAIATAELPIKITNMHSILSVSYTTPSRYNWMLQFYLRANGLELSWTGTGRLIMSLNFTDDEFNDVVNKFIVAALQMQKDGWWWQSSQLTNKSIKQQFLRDMINASFPRLGKLFPRSKNQKANSPVPMHSSLKQKI